MKRQRLSTIQAVIATACALLCGLPAFAGRPVQETHPADPDVEVEIEIFAGDLTIVGWESNSVQIEGMVSDQIRDLDISTDGTESISIEIDLPDGLFHGHDDLSANLTISVPFAAVVEIESLSAEIRAENLRGEIEIESMSGPVSISGDLQTVEAETISGNVRFSGSVQDIEVESVSGSIDVKGAEETIELTTVNGSIDVKAGTVDQCHLESVSGEVHFDGALAPGGDLDVAVHSSNVTLSLPAATSARFEVDLFSGGIENEFGVAVPEKKRWMTGKSLGFTLGSGTGSVTVEGFSGSVHLAKR